VGTKPHDFRVFGAMGLLCFGNQSEWAVDRVQGYFRETWPIIPTDQNRVSVDLLRRSIFPYFLMERNMAAEVEQDADHGHTSHNPFPNAGGLTLTGVYTLLDRGDPCVHVLFQLRNTSRHTLKRDGNVALAFAEFVDC
jgi:hypothetical protein